MKVCVSVGSSEQNRRKRRKQRLQQLKDLVLMADEVAVI